MEYSKLEQLLSQGLSFRKIAQIYGICTSTVRYWAKKFKLNSQHKSVRDMGLEEQISYGKKLAAFINSKNRTWDWQAIQKDHDEGLTWDNLREKYSISYGSLSLAQKKGLFKSVSQAEKQRRSQEKRKQLGICHSEKSRKKISLARKKYLMDNPDKHGWSNSKYHRSIPCELLKKRLRNEGLSFQEEFKPLLHKKRFFSIDIYFPDFKLGIEVNGRQHYTTNGELAPYYQQRHDLICQEGYELMEIEYHKIFQKSFVDNLIENLRVRQPRIELGPGIYLIEPVINGPALP